MIGAFLFGALGLGFFACGRKQRAIVPLCTGVALFIFPYFMPNITLLLIVDDHIDSDTLFLENIVVLAAYIDFIFQLRAPHTHATEHCPSLGQYLYIKNFKVMHQYYSLYTAYRP